MGNEGRCVLSAVVGSADASGVASTLPTDRQLLDTLLGGGSEHLVSVPCSITGSWQRWAALAAQRGEIRLTPTNHEGNLVGIAAGNYFATGKPALVHLQNSGLLNASDGFISFASPEVYGIPLLALVTWRGSDAQDDSEPHQAIGRRTAALSEAVFGAHRVYGGPHEVDLLRAARQAMRQVKRGDISALRVAASGFRCTDAPPVSKAVVRRAPEGVAARPTVQFAAPCRRDDALRAIVATHRDAAIIFCNGFTSRAAQAIVDRPGNFYLAGYMGGALAVGWGLAAMQPGLEVVVVDGDQNAAMSTMKDHLHADRPPNLCWYVLDNGVGASVGGTPSLPLQDAVRSQATVIRTVSDKGPLLYPRVRTSGAYAAFARDEAPGTLNGLTRGFRHWIAERFG